MKSVDVMKKGPYYDPETKTTTHLEEKVYTLNDQFADLVVSEDGGDYTDQVVNDSVKDGAEGLDYSKYNLTAGARRLATLKEIGYELMNKARDNSANGRITKDHLEDALLIAMDGSEE